VFLPGFLGYFGPGRDGLLGAAGLRVLGRDQDLGPGAARQHRFGAERAAEFPGGGWAGMAAMAVGAGGGVQAEFAAG
jgi:hypothetical protein